MGSVYKEQLNSWKATLDVNENIVFDIGGSQDKLQGKTKSWQVNDYKIVDLATPHVVTQMPDLVQDMNKHIDNKVFAGYLGMVDAIFMLGVMDYVINPNIAMDNISKLLSKDGYAWIEWPLFYCVHQPVEEEGCRYSEGCIRRLCKQAGLEIEEVIYKEAGNSHLLQFFIEDRQRMAKNVNHNIVGYITKLSMS